MSENTKIQTGFTTNRVGRPLQLGSPEEWWDGFLSYRQKITDSKKWIKKDFIKSGPNAGQIVDIEVTPPLTMQGFCNHIDIVYQTLLNYEKKEEFIEVIARIRGEIQDNQVTGAQLGFYDSNIVARLNGLKDRQDVTSNDNEISIAQIKFIDSTETKTD